MGGLDMRKKMGFTLVIILLVSIFTVVCSAEITSASESGINIFRPTGNIITEWGPGSGTGYSEVDDDVPDETGSYIGTSVNGKMDIYSITSQTITGLKNVTVFSRFITDFIGSKFCLLLYDETSSSISYSTPIQLSKTGTWQTISYTWETNPFTTEIWNESDINNLGIGICADYCDHYGAVFCTQTYLEVAYFIPDPPDDDGDNETPPPDDNDTNSSDDEDPTIEGLIEQVMLLNIPKRLKRRLISKLKRAIKFLNRDKLRRAINRLNAFIRLVNRLIKRDKLTETEATKLTELANQIIDNLWENLDADNIKVKCSQRFKTKVKNYLRKYTKEE
jgi:hypothetical protein